MTGQSLFPDEYPVPEPKTGHGLPCCVDLTYPPDLPVRVWEFVHALGHSRVPFTAGGLALGAQAVVPDAQKAIALAEQAGWLDRVHHEKWEGAQGAVRFMGCLPRRR